MGTEAIGFLPCAVCGDPDARRVVELAPEHILYGPVTRYRAVCDDCWLDDWIHARNEWERLTFGLTGAGPALTEAQLWGSYGMPGGRVW